MQSFYKAKFGVQRNRLCVRREAFFKQTNLQRNNRKMTISWSFSYISLVKLHGNKTVSHNTTLLYPNLCYSKVFYRGSALYMYQKRCSSQTRQHLSVRTILL